MITEKDSEAFLLDRRCLECNSVNRTCFANGNCDKFSVNQNHSFFQSVNMSLLENKNPQTDEDVYPASKTKCKYFDCDEFNNTFSNSQNSLSFLHLNIASLAKHFDNFLNFLNSLKCQFKIIGISETRISSQSIPHNVNIPGYKFYHTKTESSAGGTGIYISDDIIYKTRNDLSSLLYKSRSLESTFLEIFPDDKKSNCIIGCLYKHPNFSTEDFNSNYMNPLLEKINNEGKKNSHGRLQYQSYERRN